MARRQIKYPHTKPWTPNVARWRVFLAEYDSSKLSRQKPGNLPIAPKGGWLMYDWNTLEDRPQ